VRKALIVGAGLAGATLHYELGQLGWDTTIFEKEKDFGGLSRSSTMGGIVYEPHGSHIFHTDDREVWDFVNEMVPFWQYEHSVITMVRGKQMTWPIQYEELRTLYGDEVCREITGHRKHAEDVSTDVDFETWCKAIMPDVVYEDFIRGYTEKQWGVPAAALSAEFAPKRVQVRRDGDKRLFKDAYQGYPDARFGGSYDALHKVLWGKNPRMALNCPIKIDRLMDICASTSPDAVFVTVPLDELCYEMYGKLSWRGVDFKHQLLKDNNRGQQYFAQDALVINWPAKEWPFIRTHETKHASLQTSGWTVLTTETTGGRGRYYPMPRKGPEQKEMNLEYMAYIRKRIKVPVYFVGRLANFMYYDMDDVIRQALDTAREAHGDQ
jgi:UDP-galactopyranose mutase